MKHILHMMLAIITITASAELKAQGNSQNNLPNQGNVGIGTTAPSAKLHVNGKMQVDSSVVFTDSVSIMSDMHIMGETFHDGDLHIGGQLFMPNITTASTPCPGEMIGINDEGQLVTIADPTPQDFEEDPCASGLPAPSPYWHTNGNTVQHNQRWIGSHDNFDFNIKTHKAFRITVKNTGEVGIATRNPQQGIPLQVGNARALTFASAGTAGVYGEYIGFNAKLETGSVPNQFIKLAVPVPSSQSGGAAIITNYNGDMMIQTFDGQNANGEVQTDLKPQFRFYSDGAFEVIRQSDDKVLFKIKPDEERVYARAIRVTVNNFPDYVFDADYRLMGLYELEQYINRYGKLPGMPAAAVVETEGLDVGEMNRLLVEKVEELTLYLIELNKRIDAMQEP